MSDSNPLILGWCYWMWLDKGPSNDRRRDASLYQYKINVTSFWYIFRARNGELGMMMLSNWFQWCYPIFRARNDDAIQLIPMILYNVRAWFMELLLALCFMRITSSLKVRGNPLQMKWSNRLLVGFNFIVMGNSTTLYWMVWLLDMFLDPPILVILTFFAGWFLYMLLDPVILSWQVSGFFKAGVCYTWKQQQWEQDC